MTALYTLLAVAFYLALLVVAGLDWLRMPVGRSHSVGNNSIACGFIICIVVCLINAGLKYRRDTNRNIPRSESLQRIMLAMIGGPMLGLVVWMFATVIGSCFTENKGFVFYLTLPMLVVFSSILFQLQIATGLPKNTWIPLTEGAKLCISAAQIEASRLGMPQTSPEHLLLAIAEQDQGTGSLLLQSQGIPAELLRRKLQMATASADLPLATRTRLSSQAKNILVLAGKEAQRMRYSFIGTEHLILALACGKSTRHASVLIENGFDLERVREEVNTASISLGSAAIIPFGVALIDNHKLESKIQITTELETDRRALILFGCIAAAVTMVAIVYLWKRQARNRASTLNQPSTTSFL